MIKSLTYSKVILILFLNTLVHDYLVAQSNILTLQSDQSGSTVTNAACKEIRLLPGYRYASQQGLSMRTYINPSMMCGVNYQNGFSGSNPPPAPNTSYEVGTTPGSFAVSQNGAATYDIPLLVPPGTAGMVPHLSVSYNSHGGDGLLGIGWSLSGLSSISRTSKSEYYNGIGHTAPVTLTNSDNFVLDGSHLIPVTGNNGEDGTIYGTEIETFVRVTSHGYAGPPSNICPAYFTVETKDGTTLEYGLYYDSYIEASGNPDNPALTWLLDKVIDNRGNYIRISYFEDNSTGEFRPDHIDYTGTNDFLPYNQVKFIYNTRTDKQTAYVAGHQLQQNVLLAAVEMYALGNKAHEYNFNYSNDMGMGSHLSEVIEKGTDNKQFNSTKFVWDSNYSIKPVQHVLPVSVKGTPPSYALDVNGDGFSDILEESYNFWNLDQNNFIPPSNFSYSYPVSNYQGTLQGVPIITTYNGKMNESNLGAVDLNGDGFDDMIVYNPISDQTLSQSFDLYLSNGTGLVYKDQIISRNDGSFCAYTLGDFDGDGTTDLFTYFADGKSWYVYSFKTGAPVLLAQGVNPVNSELWTDLVDFDPTQPFIKIYPMDIDGDGKDEIVIQSTISGKLFVNSLTLSSHNTFMLNPLFISNCTTEFNDVVFPADFNGDGKTDLLIWSYDAESSVAWKISYSTGDSFVPNPNPVPLSGDYGAYTFSQSPDLYRQNQYQIFVSDFNGDGKADIVEKKADWNGDPNINYGNQGTDFHTLYGTGTGFIEDNTHFNETYPSAQFAGSVGVAISIGDFNGDGHPDLKLRDGNPASGHGPAIFTFLENKNIHKIHQIVNGLGATVNIDYNTLPLLAKVGRYTKDNHPAFPVMDFQKPMTVVADIKQDNGLSGLNETDYTYTGAKIHLQGKGFLGFNTVASTDVATNISTENTYSFPDKAHFFQRTLSQTSQSSLTGGPISERTFTYIEPFITGNGLPLLADASGLRYYFYAIKITDNDLLHGNSTITDPIIQDKWGNTTDQTSTNSAGKSIVHNGFIKIGSWIPAKIETTITTTKRGVYPSYIRSVHFVRESLTGQPINITCDGGTGIVADMFYNGFGAVETTVVSGTDVVARSYFNKYDPYGRFVTDQIDPMGHTVHMEYDDDYGNAKSKTDLNGLTTNYTYDGFGRLKTTTTPTHQQISVARAFDINHDGPQPYSLYFVRTSEALMPTSAAYFDELGRSLRDQTTGFDGTTDIKADKTYNSLGQIASQSEPFTGNAASDFTNYYYNDPFNRISNVTLPGGAYTDYTYSGNSTTAKTTQPSAQGTITKTVTKELDASGALISSTDNGGIISYDYHSCGKPKTITAPGSGSITMEYDDFGRQTKLVDPDAGKSTYSYDVLGELIHQQNAKQFEADPSYSYTLTYDLLGRMTKKSSPQEGDITYTYDKPNGIGLIGTVAGFNGITYDYEYNSQGLLKSKTESGIDPANPSFTTSFFYDALNRCTTEVYPGSSNPFTINMSYKSSGYLEKIFNANNTSTPIWQCNSMNERGRVTSSTSGNGLDLTKQYSQLGYIENESVNSSPQWGQSYCFDATTGNLTSRGNAPAAPNLCGTSTLPGLYETFTYDNLDRLNNITLNPNTPSSTSINTGYYTAGNIGSKTDVGSYVYAGAQPHAVSTINDPTTNMLTGAIQQTITYTPFNKAENISEGANSLQFTYGPDNARKKSVLTGPIARTVISVSNYEKITTGSGIYEVHYINTPDGLAAIDVRHNGGADQMNYVYTDHLGSINIIFDQNKTKVFEQSFDAWGRNRNPDDWTYNNIPNAPDWLIRGYTGHEHHKEFGLINMNGRMYDPLLGRMLSPDNQVQQPDFTESYNRYSYVMNNPLKYTDPSGMNGVDYYDGSSCWTDPNSRYWETQKMIGSKAWNAMNSWQQSAWLTAHNGYGGHTHEGLGGADGGNSEYVMGDMDFSAVGFDIQSRQNFDQIDGQGGYYRDDSYSIPSESSNILPEFNKVLTWVSTPSTTDYGSIGHTSGGGMQGGTDWTEVENGALAVVGGALAVATGVGYSVGTAGIGVLLGGAVAISTGIATVGFGAGKIANGFMNGGKKIPGGPAEGIDLAFRGNGSTGQLIDIFSGGLPHTTVETGLMGINFYYSNVGQAVFSPLYINRSDYQNNILPSMAPADNTNVVMPMPH